MTEIATSNSRASNCTSEQARNLGYFWSGAFLFNPDGEKVARYAMSLCSSSGTWATERVTTKRSHTAKHISDADPIIAKGFELEDVKRITEEWITTHPHSTLQ
jgi:hypothetical protein